MRPTIACTMPTSMLGRKSMKRSACADTSSSVIFASTSRAFGPAIDKPTRPRPIGLTETLPSVGRCSANQRIWYFSAAPDPNKKKCWSAALASVKSPISFPLRLSIGSSIMRPTFGILLASNCESQASAPIPVTSYFAKADVSEMPTPLRTAWHSAFTCAKSVERWNENLSSTPGGANHSGDSTAQLSPITAPISIHLWCIGTVRSGLAAGNSSFGKRTRNLRP